jgi:hypothetical protein
MFATCNYCGKHRDAYTTWWKSPKWGNICDPCYYLLSFAKASARKVYPCIYCNLKTTLSGKVCQRCRIKQSEGITLKKKRVRKKVKSMSDTRWIEKWTVVGTSGKKYTVARDADNKFGCDCPAWKFQKGSQRRDCSHILLKKFDLIKKAGGGVEALTKPEIPEPSGHIRGIRFDD